MRVTLVILLLVLTSLTAKADNPGPNELVEQTTELILQEFTANRAIYEADNQKLYDMVERIAIPHFNFERMSKLVLGRHWPRASDAQRLQFQQAFKTLLVRTYATALYQYSGEKMKYLPAVAVDGDMVVREEIDVGTAHPVKLEYYLGKNADAWKVYDVRIDGISLVTNYRKSYDIMIRSKGLTALIAALENKNSQLVTQ